MGGRRGEVFVVSRLQVKMWVAIAKNDQFKSRQWSLRWRMMLISKWCCWWWHWCRWQLLAYYHYPRYLKQPAPMRETADRWKEEEKGWKRFIFKILAHTRLVFKVTFNHQRGFKNGLTLTACSPRLAFCRKVVAASFGFPPGQRKNILLQKEEKSNTMVRHQFFW